MTAILLVTALTGVVMYLLYGYMLADTKKRLKAPETPVIYLSVLLIAAFVVRIIAASQYSGHATDMNCFNAWSSRIYKDGFSNFYTSESFSDYPPGYMYVLYIIGALKSALGLSGDSAYTLVKMPAMICDILTGIVLYKIAVKHLCKKRSLLVVGMFVFCPAVILNSAIWGQVDSVYTLVLLLMIYFIADKRMIPAYYLFAACIFIKPQAFILTPVLILGIVDTVFLPKFDKKKFWKNLGWGLGAIAMMFILSLPFGITNVIDQYKATLDSYPYKTVNAFNMWGAFGENWGTLTTAATVIGWLFIVAVVAYAVYIFLKSKNPAKYYFMGALLVFTTFMFSTRMHDRYAYPAVALLFAAFVITPTRNGFIATTLMSLSQFFNTAWVLFIYEQDINYYYKSPVIVVASIINLLLYAYIIYVSQKEYVKYKPPVVEKAKQSAKYGKKNRANNQPAKKPAPASSSSQTAHAFRRSDHGGKMTARDWIIVGVVTVIYAGIALYNLGDMYAPETELSVANTTITLDYGSDVTFGEYGFFNSYKEFGDERALKVEFKNSANQVVKTENLTSAAVFYWTEKSISSVTARYVTLSSEDVDALELKEFYTKDTDGNLLTPVNADDYAALFDEQEMVPEKATFENSTIFDEIYHARTAYEFLHGLPVYEWTHPPFGKVLIALGISIFGMNPFGWRIAGTFIGILMVPLMYVFAKKMLKKTWLAAFTCLLLTFDFMHFTQSRIATIDIYGTFFILLMYYFMYKYLSMSFYDTSLKKTFIPLGLSGISMGFAIASKWTGMYAAAGLAILFFISLYHRYKEYLWAKKFPARETSGIAHKEVIDKFPHYCTMTIIFCVVFFVIVPALIYCGSYFMYLRAPGSEGLKTIIENQSSMYTYHSKTVLGSTHAYSSKWYEWIIMKRPILYYSETTAEGLKRGISAFGNPAVWWVGFIALIFMGYTWIKKKDHTASVMTIGYLSVLVPWIPISRLTFIYHYFPMVPFLVLSLGYSMKLLYDNAPANRKRTVIIGSAVFTAVAIGLFAMFYPVLSGYPISDAYGKLLKWFSTWVLIR